VSVGVAVVVLTPATTRLSPNPRAVNSTINSQVEANGADRTPEQTRLSGEISDALLAEKWPVLSPSLEDVVSRRADSYVKECMDDVRKSIADCTLGAVEAPHAIVLVGDSTSMTYAGAFESIVNASNGQWRLELRNLIGCSFMVGRFRLPFVDDAKERSCPANVESTISAIEAERPDIVVVVNGYWPHEFVSSGKEQTLQERQESIRSVVERISQSSGKLILMSPPPYSVDVRECYNKISSPINCVGSMPVRWPEYESIDRRIANEIDNASFLSTWRWFCSGSGRCPAFVDTVPVRYDSLHLTGAFSRRLGPVVREAFSAFGVTF
jgi:hypothetical protein